MNPNREPRDFSETVKRYEDTLASLKLVAHYSSKELLGRKPTEFETKQFLDKRKAMQAALYNLCIYRCPDNATLRRKLRWLHNFLKDRDNSLGRAEMFGVVQSILQQWELVKEHAPASSV